MNQLLLGGCTRRGLAKDLSCDEGIIRRNCRIAALSGADRAAIENGANPDPLLNRQHCWVERIDDVCRLLRESLDGSVSTDLASNIVWYLCFYEPDLCLHSEMRNKVHQKARENRTSLINKALDKASQIVRGFESRNRSADIELVDSTKTLSPDVFAVALQDYMQVKNSIPKASRRLVA